MSALLHDAQLVWFCCKFIQDTRRLIFTTVDKVLYKMLQKTVFGVFMVHSVFLLKVTCFIYYLSGINFYWH